jgi:hypothetical protein
MYRRWPEMWLYVDDFPEYQSLPGDTSIIFEGLQNWDILKHNMLSPSRYGPKPDRVLEEPPPPYTP